MSSDASAAAVHEPIHWGARALLFLAVLTWFVLRVPLAGQFAQQAHNDARRVLASDLPLYYAMADATLRHGTLASYTPAAVAPLQALVNERTDYRHFVEPADAPLRLFDYNDWGYSLVVAGSWLVPGAPRNLWVVLGVQLLVDAVCLVLLCFVGARLFSAWAGAGAALFYALHPTLGSLSTTPYYYYWAVPPVIVVLLVWSFFAREKADGPAWRWAALVVLMGLVVGVGALVRGTTGTLAAALLVAIVLWSGLRWRTLVLVGCLGVATLLPLVPNAVVKYRLHGQVQFRAKEIFWHTILCGVGNWDNPWGLEWQDEVAFERIRAKYGVAYSLDNARAYDAACHEEVRGLMAENPGIFVRNFWRNFAFGMKFRSAIPADQDVPAIHRALNQLRLLAALGWLGLLWAAWRRRELRVHVLLVSMLVLLPVLQIAPICRPVHAYIAGMFPVEALIGGAGLALLCESLMAWGASRSRVPAPTPATIAAES